LSKILVTGAAGYIGSKLCTHLINSGHEVYAIDNFFFKQYPVLNHLIDNVNFHVFNKDVRDLDSYKDLVNRADVIIPLAALVGQHICDKFPELAQETNFDAIATLVSHLQHKKTLILFPNTNSGYGTTDGESLCTENTPMNPISTYGITKCRAEKAVLTHPYSYVFRLATVAGVSPRPRLDLLINDLVYKAHFNIKTEIYEPTYMRNFVHINDVCKAFLWAINVQQYKPLEDRVFNLGNDRLNCSKWDLVTKIKEFYPNWDVSVNDNQKDIDQRNYIVSSKRLESYGFKAIIDLDTTIQQLGKFFGTATSSDLLEGMNNKT
jgi:nucleoside-diphosphate-sugar epimerase